MDNHVISIEFVDEDGSLKVEREYVSTDDADDAEIDAEIKDILRSYIDAGCRILRWTWWQ